MKSAYELAMERLEQADPEANRTLSDEQKEELAALDRKYEAKIAEREIFLNKQIADARSQRDATALAQLEEQRRNEKARLQEEREEAKDKVRRA